MGRGGINDDANIVKCPQCGKTFCIYTGRDSWGWYAIPKKRKLYFCSYTCMRTAIKAAKEAEK